MTSYLEAGDHRDLLRHAAADVVVVAQDEHLQPAELAERERLHLLDQVLAEV